MRKVLAMALWGQVDVKAVLTTLVGAAIIGAFTTLWQKAEAGEEALRETVAINKRLSRMEDWMERNEKKPVAVPAKGAKR